MIAPADLSPFLSQYGVIGVPRLQQVHADLLGRMIDLRHEFVAPFRLHVELTRAREIPQREIACLARSFDGCVQ